jgi:hypothetical protein
MQTRVVRCLGAILFLTAATTLLGAGAAGGIAVDLKKCKFKVPETVASLFGYNEDEGKLFFYTNGPAETTVKLPADGSYEITVKASGDKAKDERAKFKLSIDDKLMGKETTLTVDEPRDYTFTAELKAGERRVKIEFTNDEYKENEYDRNLYIHAVTFRKK